MNDAELREKIVTAIRNTLLKSEGRITPTGMIPGPGVPFHMADAILALVLPAIQAARGEALREAEKVAARLNMIPADCEYGSVEWDTNAGVCRLETRGGSCQCLERAEGAEAVEKAIAALIEKETAP